MKAIVYPRFGPPEVLQVQDVETPVPGDDQMLVRVHAVSLNPAEMHMMTGIPMARILGGNGLLRPRQKIPGGDFAGIVQAVGKNCTGYKQGDVVFGRRSSLALAEYVCVTGKAIAPKPANATFEQAAAVPVAALTALQSLRDSAHVRRGQEVLINGAAGGVGTFSVQIAQALGADVTAVCSTRNVDLVRSLGANRVIDYTQEDFSRNGAQYDVIIDNVGNRSVSDRVRVLKPGGICVGVGYTSVPLLVQTFVLGRWVSLTSNKKIGSMLAHITKEDLLVMKELIEAGKVSPVVEKCYSPGEAAQAYRYLQTKHARGKLVIRMGVNDDRGVSN